MIDVETDEKLEKLLSDLQYAIDNNAIVVVEGPNDEKALRALGIHGKVAQLSKKPYSELAEELVGITNEAIILTDFDNYGKKAAVKLRDSFSNECIKVDTTFRKRFKKLFDYVEFEDIPSLIK